MLLLGSSIGSQIECVPLRVAQFLRFTFPAEDGTPVKYVRPIAFSGNEGCERWALSNPFQLAGFDIESLVRCELLLLPEFGFLHG